MPGLNTHTETVRRSAILCALVVAALLLAAHVLVEGRAGHDDHACAICALVATAAIVCAAFMPLVAQAVFAFDVAPFPVHVSPDTVRYSPRAPPH